LQIIHNKSSLLITFFIFLLLCIMISLPLGINTKISDLEADILYKLRGSRSVSDEIFVVYIGDEDISVLNGWPFTRDYFSYAIHALKSSGAKTIAIDILFSGPDNHYQNYDQALVDFVTSAGNVCLPMIFSELQSDSLEPGLMTGINPQYSFDPLPEIAAGTGFSNFAVSPVISHTPLLVKINKDSIFSFALESVRLYLEPSQFKFNPDKSTILLNDNQIALNENGELWLNYFGDPDNINSISFVNLLQTFRNNPEDLKVKNKLVLIITTASGVAQVKSTPVNSSMPASLIHVNSIDNILQQNWLRQAHPIIMWLILIMCVILIYWLAMIRNIYIKVLSIGVFILIYITFATWIFSQFSTVLPIIYPALLSSSIILILIRQKTALKQEKSARHSDLLHSQLIEKEKKLEVVKTELKASQNELAATSSQSEESIQQIENLQSKIDQMEKELSDLRSYILPVSSGKDLEAPDLIHSGTGKMVEIVDMIYKVCSDTIPVFILGETGTGKEVIAREIHNNSPRKNSPFIAVNCGALSENLLESELFGHKKGSFTGAISDRKGRFELADGGTIFLDEITETMPAFQTKLLRVLQEGSFEPVGSESAIKIDVRVIAATNKDIKEIVKEENFRSDLYYRLNGFMISVPPLRERTDDIPLLIKHFLQKHEYKKITGVSERALDLFNDYSWPGNVRELENTIRRAAILASSENRPLIQENDLPDEIQNQSSEIKLRSVHQPLEEQILDLLRSLKFSRSSITQTAKILGNRDRGTITEYFKGICFEALVNSDYSIQLASREIAGTDDPNTLNLVSIKLNNYIDNLRQYQNINNSKEQTQDKLTAPFRGLPQKYHTSLSLVLQNLDKIS
jgi:transcriptional regulator with PAS, ATPase and Fis domain/CHASE2 domain-containing sensor protein